mmetsp:Transcript_8499/g.24373  ORF Transcript_8499/g.24373 Transcript_8499/m.24373 type:complete len:268 (-) Transcript_8499:2858-3661(-)
MAKSELLTAWRPSLPMMPMPTSAAWIMATSLAPSPMLSIFPVIRFSNLRFHARRPEAPRTAILYSKSLISFTMHAFWLGEARQTTTLAQYDPSSASTGSMLVPRMWVRVWPSITSSCVAACPLDELFLSSSGCCAIMRSCGEVMLPTCRRPALTGSTVSISSRRRDLHDTYESELKIIALSGCLSRRQLVAMLIAVSCLSPVIIHTLIPASRRVAMASGTPFCSLSSMAVIPTSSRSCSTSSCSLAICSSRPSRRDDAAWKRMSQSR